VTFLTCCTVKVSQQASWSAAAIAARMFSADVQATSDKLLGGMMLLVAAVVFLYYTIWALFLVSSYAHLFAGRESLRRYPAQCGRLPRCYQTVLRQHHTHPCRAHPQPFLDPNSSLHSFFPAREWAIRLPAGLLLLGITGIGLFFAKVTMEEARKRAARSGKSA